MSRRPNILFIAVDDLNHWPRCMGKYPDAITPSIDRLAARGTLFTEAHTTAPVCLPARVAALSGLRPSTSGCYTLCPPISDDGAWRSSDPLQRTVPLPLHFRRAGYRTCVSGKVFHGRAREEAEAAEASGEPLWDEHNHGAARGANQLNRTSSAFRAMEDAPEAGRSLHWGPLDADQAGSLSDEATVQWATDRLSREMDRPFLLACGFFKPHVPLHAPEDCFDLYDRAEITVPEPDEDAFNALPEAAKAFALSAGNNFDHLGGSYYQFRRHGRLREFVHAYLASISYLDQCVGRVLDALDASPHADNTIVALWADHGWSLGDHFHVQKSALWSCVTNVPLIIAEPGRASAVCPTPVSTLDLYPTLADLCGLPPRSEWEGHSLRPLMDDPATDWPHAAVTHHGPDNCSVRTREGTLIRYFDGSEELYGPPDTDPAETRNLAGDPAHAVRARRLAAHIPEHPRPPLFRANDPHGGNTTDLRPGDSVPFGTVDGAIAGRPIRIRARVDASRSPDAIIVHLNGIHTGFALSLRDRFLQFTVRNVPAPLQWDRFTPVTESLRPDRPLPHKPVEIDVEMDDQGSVTFALDGGIIGHGRASGPLRVPPTAPLRIGFIPENDRISRDVPLLDGEAAMRGQPLPEGLERVSITFAKPAN